MRLLPYASHMCCEASSKGSVLRIVDYVPVAILLWKKMEQNSIRMERERERESKYKILEPVPTVSITAPSVL